MECKICKFFLQDLCGGVNKNCEDFISVPIIKDEEKMYWEKEGDASRYRKKRFAYSSGGGYSIIYPYV